MQMIVKGVGGDYATAVRNSLKSYAGTTIITVPITLSLDTWPRGQDIPMSKLRSLTQRIDNYSPPTPTSAVAAPLAGTARTACTAFGRRTCTAFGHPLECTGTNRSCIAFAIRLNNPQAISLSYSLQVIENQSELLDIFRNSGVSSTKAVSQEYEEGMTMTKVKRVKASNAFVKLGKITPEDCIRNGVQTIPLSNKTFQSYLEASVVWACNTRSLWTVINTKIKASARKSKSLLGVLDVLYTTAEYPLR
jgi:hypothetical protein